MCSHRASVHTVPAHWQDVFTPCQCSHCASSLGRMVVPHLVPRFRLGQGICWFPHPVGQGWFPTLGWPKASRLARDWWFPTTRVGLTSGFWDPFRVFPGSWVPGNIYGSGFGPGEFGLGLVPHRLTV